MQTANLVVAVMMGALTYFYPGDLTGVLLVLADIYGGYLVWNNLQIIK